MNQYFYIGFIFRHGPLESTPVLVKVIGAFRCKNCMGEIKSTGGICVSVSVKVMNHPLDNDDAVFY